MKLKLLVITLILLSVSLCSGIALADSSEPLIMAKQIESQPVNAIRYLDAGVDYVVEIIQRIIKTGKPVVIFKEETSKFGLGVSIIEDFLGKNVDLVGGVAFTEEREETTLFWGLEYKFSGEGMGGIFSRLRPAIYAMQDQYYWGISFELRPE